VAIIQSPFLKYNHVKVILFISGDTLPGMDENSDNMEAELGFQQVPVLQQNLARLQQQQACGASGLQPPSSPYDEAELDALAEIERIEREAASEKCSKEVQDKGMWNSMKWLCGYMLEMHRSGFLVPITEISTCRSDITDHGVD